MRLRISPFVGRLLLHETATGPDLDRRRMLKLGLVLPFCALPVSLPLRAEAKTAPPVPDRKPRAPKLLMIDPGHGGHDPGAIGLHGAQEKDLTLDIALRMAERLADERLVTVRLTRNTDVFMPLNERVKAGREANADLFVSIHADSAPNSAARGLSVYTLSEKASDQLANAIAEKENLADVIGGMDLSQADQQVAAILYDLAARRALNTAQRAKAGFVRGMGRQWRLLEKPMRAANFAVLRAPDIPSMLIETGFLSNAKDEALLTQPKQRKKIAALMAQEMASLLKSSLFG